MDVDHRRSARTRFHLHDRSRSRQAELAVCWHGIRPVLHDSTAGEKWIPLKGRTPDDRGPGPGNSASEKTTWPLGRLGAVSTSWMITLHLRELSEELVEKDAHIFPIKKALMYIETNPLGGGDKAFQGASFFTAPNPPFGATFTYWLGNSLETQKGKRQIPGSCAGQTG